MSHSLQQWQQTGVHAHFLLVDGCACFAVYGTPSAALPSILSVCAASTPMPQHSAQAYTDVDAPHTQVDLCHLGHHQHRSLNGGSWQQLALRLRSLCAAALLSALSYAAPEAAGSWQGSCTHVLEQQLGTYIWCLLLKALWYYGCS